MSEGKLKGLGILSLIFMTFTFVSVISSAEIVDAGERAIVLKYGKVVDVKNEGFYWRMPFVTDYQKIDVRTNKVESSASAASKDLQTVQTKIALNYNLIPDEVGLLWQELGRDYLPRVITPAIQEAVKSSTAEFTAEELITKRAEVNDKIKAVLVAKLQSQHINVSDLSIINFQFSASFNNAIEAKVTAEQRALEAKNDLDRIKTEAQQQIESAKAEAESIRIQAQAITSQGGKDYVQLQAIGKWDGKLPTQFVPGSAVPFLNLK